MSAKSRERKANAIARTVKLQDARELENARHRGRLYDVLMANWKRQYDASQAAEDEWSASWDEDLGDFALPCPENLSDGYEYVMYRKHVVVDASRLAEDAAFDTAWDACHERDLQDGETRPWYMPDGIDRLPVQMPFAEMFVEWTTSRRRYGVLLDFCDSREWERSHGIWIYALHYVCENGVISMESDLSTVWLDESFYAGEIDGFDTRGGKLRALQLVVAFALDVVRFMNVKNVELIECEPSNDASAEYEKRFGVPLTKYRTLAITPMGKRYERDDKPQQQFDVMPLHIRRGNFARYTADAPLFGKYTGTFWRPATVVGSEKNGIVVKDYKLQAHDAR